MNNRYIMYMSPLIMGFMLGVIVTLLSTGSIKIHNENIIHPKSSESQPATIPVSTALPVVKEQTPLPQPKINSQVQFSAEDLMVVPANTSPEKAREILLAEYKKSLSIKQGSGDNHLYILFDPLCKHCHKLYQNLDAEWISTYNITAHWIPSVVFHDIPEAQEIAHKMMQALMNGQFDLAKNALKAIVNGQPSALFNAVVEISEEAQFRVGRNSAAIIQTGGGTPIVMFEDKDGIQILSGEPYAEDLENFGS